MPKFPPGDPAYGCLATAEEFEYWVAEEVQEQSVGDRKEPMSNWGVTSVGVDSFDVFGEAARSMGEGCDGVGNETCY